MTMAVKAPSTMRISSGVPATARHLFPEYDLSTWDESSEKVVNVIIQRILEGGTTPELKWLFATYGEERVAKWVQERGLRGLTRKAFAYWRLVLRIKDFKRPPWIKHTDDPYPDPAPGLWGR